VPCLPAPRLSPVPDVKIPRPPADEAPDGPPPGAGQAACGHAACAGLPHCAAYLGHGAPPWFPPAPPKQARSAASSRLLLLGLLRACCCAWTAHARRPCCVQSSVSNSGKEAKAAAVPSARAQAAAVNLTLPADAPEDAAAAAKCLEAALELWEDWHAAAARRLPPEQARARPGPNAVLRRRACAGGGRKPRVRRLTSAESAHAAARRRAARRFCWFGTCGACAGQGATAGDHPRAAWALGLVVTPAPSGQPAVQGWRPKAHARVGTQAACELRKLATRTAGAVGAAAQSGVARQQMGELLHYASGAPARPAAVHAARPAC